MRLLIGLNLLCLSANSQEAAALIKDQQVVEDGSQAVHLLIESLGGLQGASALAIVALLVQIVMRLMKTKIGGFAGKYRLLLVYGLSVVGGILGLKLTGLEWSAALIHTQTMAAFQIFIHQLYKQFYEKRA